MASCQDSSTEVEAVALSMGALACRECGPVATTSGSSNKPNAEVRHRSGRDKIEMNPTERKGSQRQSGISNLRPTYGTREHKTDVYRRGTGPEGYEHERMGFTTIICRSCPRATPFT